MNFSAAVNEDYITGINCYNSSHCSKVITTLDESSCKSGQLFYYKSRQSLLQIVFLLQNGMILEISTQDYSDIIRNVKMYYFNLQLAISHLDQQQLFQIALEIDILIFSEPQKQLQLLSCHKTVSQLNFISRLHLYRYFSMHHKLLNNDSNTDTRYFPRSKFSRSLVHKKNFGLNSF